MQRRLCEGDWTWANSWWRLDQEEGNLNNLDTQISQLDKGQQDYGDWHKRVCGSN